MSSEFVEALEAATAPNPGIEAETTAEPVTETGTEQPTGDGKGAGSKDALKADLARERDKRQALEARVNQLTEGLTKALGITPDEPEQLTAEQLTARLDTATAEARAARVQLTVHQLAPAGVDTASLLDSRAFCDTLAGLDPADRDAIATAITAHVEKNPRFKTRPATSGDLYQHNTAPNPGHGVNRIASAINRT